MCLKQGSFLAVDLLAFLVAMMQVGLWTGSRCLWKFSSSSRGNTWKRRRIACHSSFPLAAMSWIVETVRNTPLSLFRSRVFIFQGSEAVLLVPEHDSESCSMLLSAPFSVLLVWGCLGILVWDFCLGLFGQVAVLGSLLSLTVLFLRCCFGLFGVVSLNKNSCPVESEDMFLFNKKTYVLV